MKSNRNLMLFAVHFFSLIISLSTSPTKSLRKSVSSICLEGMPQSIFDLYKNITDLSEGLMKKEFVSSIALKLQADYYKIASDARTKIKNNDIKGGRDILFEGTKECFDPFGGNQVETKINEVIDKFINDVLKEP